MSYIPVVFVNPPAPSRRARELSERLRVTIDDYRRYEPGATVNEVRQALDLARPGTGSPRGMWAITTLVGVMTLLGLVYFARGGAAIEMPWILIGLAALAAVGLLTAALAARSGGG